MVYQPSFSNLRLQARGQHRLSVIFYYNKRRYRFSNGNIIGVELHPNKLPVSLRESAALDLLFAFKQALDNGWSPTQQPKQSLSLQQVLVTVQFDNALTSKYLKDLHRTRERFTRYVRSLSLLSPSELTKWHCQDYLRSVTSSPSTFNHERKRLSTILKLAFDEINIPNPVAGIKKKREKQSLHKPILDIPGLLQEIYAFDKRLHLCCLLTYGCLLRPHQEIRKLTWGDFSEDLSFISLSGSRNKSGRNRIVPIPEYVREHLSGGESTCNIFSSHEEPFNETYFKGLWGKFKKQSLLLQPEQTLYSFRHTGAIAVFKQTGSIQKLQQVMGHASLAVTLGYLRGVDVPQLEVVDMPLL